MVSNSSLSIKRVGAIGLAASSFAAAGPCDIYAQGNTPCVAAHSSTRALYDNYQGPLYQVKRGSDGQTKDIGPLNQGGVAKSSDQDSFCTGTTCLISIIYDQSGRGNHLTQAPPGGAARGPQANGYDDLAGALGAPVTLNGQKAYGVFISPSTGYRCNTAKGTAVKDQPQGIYALVDGTHYNAPCCFDYGNAETSSDDTGNGHMETVYFGTGSDFSHGEGNGPWVLADLENGLFASNMSHGVVSTNPSQTSRFVTGIVKGKPNHWAIRGGNGASGGLSTYYDGERPTAGGYNPMSREGAIILGIGGDNSNGAQGTFYEGVMTSGYPSDDTENKVQENIVAAKYATTSLTSGTPVNVGSKYSLQVTTPTFENRYIIHNGSDMVTAVVDSSSGSRLKRQASFTARTGLSNAACISFESVDTPGSFIRHSNYQLFLNANDGSKLFGEDATFCPQTGLNGKANADTFRSWSYPAHYFRHRNAQLYIAANGGPRDIDSTYSFNDDASFVVAKSFA